MRMRTFRAGSIQSKLTCLALRASEATIWASWKAISRTSFTSGPLTRYCTGQPTGGPSSSGDGSGHRAREIVPQHRLELRAQPLAGGDILGDDHELAEEIVGELRR